MADCPTAIILAALFLSSGIHLFTRSYEKNEGCDCTTLSSVIFLTSVFAWVSAKNINIFRCKFPDKGNFIYEFFVSMFIFEMALRLFWEPLECFIASTLPLHVENWLLDGGSCCFYGIYCPGDTLFFTILVYIMAFLFVWYALYGYGVFAVKI